MAAPEVRAEFAALNSMEGLTPQERLVRLRHLREVVEMMIEENVKAAKEEAEREDFAALMNSADFRNFLRDLYVAHKEAK